MSGNIKDLGCQFVNTSKGVDIFAIKEILRESWVVTPWI